MRNIACFIPNSPLGTKADSLCGLPHQQKITLILGATEFFDPDYQKAIIPFLIDYVEKSDAPPQIAACELLANMPKTAAPALPALKRLLASADPAVCQAAQPATDRIILGKD
jgi:hypothetical protein